MGGISIGDYNSNLTNAIIHYNHIHDNSLFPPVTVAATCTTEGYTIASCANCGASGERYDIVPSLGGHQMVVLPAVEPTCTESGLTAGSACQQCQMVGVAQKEVPAAGHSYVDGVCTVCADKCYTPGDVDGVEGVSVDDAIYLLQHVLMPELFPLK